MLAALLDVGSKPTTSTTFKFYGGDWIWQGDKDITKINAIIGTQINTVKADTFAALAAIRLLAKEGVATEESVLAMAA